MALHCPSCGQHGAVQEDVQGHAAFTLTADGGFGAREFVLVLTAFADLGTDSWVGGAVPDARYVPL